jgi:nucleoside-diphosphate-sugar epimerase
LEYCQSRGAQGLIYFSTVVVHGTVRDSVLDEDTPISEPDFYGATKYLGERVLENADVPTLTIRLPGVVGPSLWQNRPWVGKVLDRLRAGQKVDYYNGNSLFNNVIDFRNICKFVSHIISNLQGMPASHVLLAARNPMPLRKVIELLKAKTGSRSSCAEKPSTNNSYSISNSRLIQLFRFKPDTTRQILGRFLKEDLGS